LRIGTPGTVPNLDGVVRSKIDIKIGTKMAKHFTGVGLCDGKVIAYAKVNSTIHTNQEVDAYTVKYTVDGATEDLEDEEIRPLLVLTGNALRADALDSVRPAFTYLENRITNRCQENFHYGQTHSMFGCFRCFDPGRAYDLDIQDIDIDQLELEFPPIQVHGLAAGMKAMLSTYLSLGRDFETDRSSVEDFTRDVLRFWRVHGDSLGAWKQAARMAFCVSPNSATSERVFSALQDMFGSKQDRTLGDQVEAGLMLRFNHEDDRFG
jgi:hypothetical protein